MIIIDKQYIHKQLDRVMKVHRKNGQLLNDIKNLIDLNPNPDIIGPLLNQYINDVSKEALMSRNLPADIGIVKDVCRVTDNDYEIEMIKIDKGFLFILPDLLPKRDSEKKAELNFVKYNYASAFHKLNERERFQKIEKKVHISITNYFVNETVMIDNDNVNVKPIIDTISTYLLVDDNPLWCDLSIRGKIGKYNHSEIEIFIE